MLNISCIRPAEQAPKKFLPAIPKFWFTWIFFGERKLQGLLFFIDSYLFARLHDWLRFVIPPTILFLWVVQQWFTKAIGGWVSLLFPIPRYISMNGRMPRNSNWCCSHLFMFSFKLFRLLGKPTFQRVGSSVDGCFAETLKRSEQKSCVLCTAGMYVHIRIPLDNWTPVGQWAMSRCSMENFLVAHRIFS